eukprot:4834821-Pyramimonas_sp.AAC.1
MGIRLRTWMWTDNGRQRGTIGIRSVIGIDMGAGRWIRIGLGIGAGQRGPRAALGSCSGCARYVWCTPCGAGHLVYA